MQFPYTIVDLTHCLDEQAPGWETHCGFQVDIAMDYSTQNSQFRVQHIKMPAGMGTHIDAPAHCFPAGLTIEELNLRHLLAPCVVIDVSASANAQYSVSLQDVQNFEREIDPLPPGCFVMIRTGWEQFWSQPEKYRNHYRFPSVSLPAAEYLLTKGIVGLGIDTLSPDRPEDGFAVHKCLLGAGKYIVENAANLENLPLSGGFIWAIPIKIKEGTEAPIRLVALIPL